MKVKTVFVCQSCGSQSPRWLGKCPVCGDWNSYVEERTVPRSPDSRTSIGGASYPVQLHEIEGREEDRTPTGIKEFDRVLGGGIVPGSVILIGGDPGIGKSTLTLQSVSQISAQKLKVLYVTGEESVRQTKMRAQRLQLPPEDNFFLVNQIDLQVIKDHIQQLKPDVVVIDSIQVIYDPQITSSPGSVSQVRECAASLTQLAKAESIALFLIGHVTKEGMLAGPRVLEHLVDTVLYFEGERYTSHRVLRTLKNRFGSTNELGVFEMTAQGLREVDNPSEIFLAERPQNVPGSVVVPILEGTRPFLVEVQGLVSRSTFGVVRQKTQGFDSNRLALLVAVLEKRLGLNVQDKDIFLNIVGGVKVMDPAADLSVVVAVASALLDKVVSFETVVVGEVGLSAEVRSVSQLGLRLNEAHKLGFRRAIIPQNNRWKNERPDMESLELIPVTSVREAMDRL